MPVRDLEAERQWLDWQLRFRRGMRSQDRAGDIRLSDVRSIDPLLSDPNGAICAALGIPESNPREPLAELSPEAGTNLHFYAGRVMDWLAESTSGAEGAQSREDSLPVHLGDGEEPVWGHCDLVVRTAGGELSLADHKSASEWKFDRMADGGAAYGDCVQAAVYAEAQERRGAVLDAVRVIYWSKKNYGAQRIFRLSSEERRVYARAGLSHLADLRVMVRDRRLWSAQYLAGVAERMHGAAEAKKSAYACGGKGWPLDKTGRDGVRWCSPWLDYYRSVGVFSVRAATLPIPAG